MFALPFVDGESLTLEVCFFSAGLVCCSRSSFHQTSRLRLTKALTHLRAVRSRQLGVLGLLGGRLFLDHRHLDLIGHVNETNRSCQLTADLLRTFSGVTSPGRRAITAPLQCTLWLPTAFGSSGPHRLHVYVRSMIRVGQESVLARRLGEG